MTQNMLAAALAIGLVTSTAHAGAKPLTEACEVALALSAVPERLRSDASVYVRGDSGFRQAVKGEGAMTCIVERNHPDSIIPQCADAAGAEAIIPAIIFRSERVLAGASAAEAREEFMKGAEAGRFTKPARSGVNYMASAYNYIYVDSRDAILKVPPHVMFYAPDVKNADIGGSLGDALKNHGMPFLFQEGSPHAYMVTFLNEASEVDGVEASCAGQIGPPPPPAFAAAGGR